MAEQLELFGPHGPKHSKPAIRKEPPATLHAPIPVTRDLDLRTRPDPAHESIHRIVKRWVDEKKLYKHDQEDAVKILETAAKAGVAPHSLAKAHPSRWFELKQVKQLESRAKETENYNAHLGLRALQERIREVFDHSLFNIKTVESIRRKAPHMQKFFRRLGEELYEGAHYSIYDPRTQSGKSHFRRWIEKNPGAIEWHLGLTPEEIIYHDLTPEVGRNGGRLSTANIRKAFIKLIRESDLPKSEKKRQVLLHSIPRWEKRAAQRRQRKGESMIPETIEREPGEEG